MPPLRLDGHCVRIRSRKRAEGPRRPPGRDSHGWFSAAVAIAAGDAGLLRCQNESWCSVEVRRDSLIFLERTCNVQSAFVQNKTITLTINEIYRSIQGESTWAGLPCVFVRLTFCDLRCIYCDTTYAFYAGSKMTLPEILQKVLAFDCPLVEITGGEPLLQRNVLPLMTELCDRGKTVLIETSGAHDISGIDSRVHRIMDLKTPGSGESERNRYDNIAYLSSRDEVKFVIGSREDYLWSKQKIGEFDLIGRSGTVLFSPIFGRIDPRQIVDWLLEDNLQVRFQLQMHKFIWSPETKGV
jgi:7-carboxy-7-deazaguanine synthase